ncbi:hypothetical protein EG68_00049 [Paragonimus skrjabini miyazakii]|uniref:Protein quiver n=1 Tax=Paragonimus skrjabini miyazakii TaxID=59628 RepID=A0A8S9Z598_9TREM|nr:hypothetical protein EG68_00049 [Paragonimus skrjabini miyazakii]
MFRNEIESRNYDRLMSGTMSLNTQFYSSRPLTPYQRSFTPVRNISCSQCHMEMKKLDESTTYVEHEMTMRQCLDEPAKFFKPCPLDGNVAPRGCAKIVTYMMQPVAKGLMREVSTVRRFCASEGAEPEEIRCEYMIATGGHSELCICGHDNCNQADALQRTHIGLMMTTLLSTMIYAN